MAGGIVDPAVIERLGVSTQQRAPRKAEGDLGEDAFLRLIITQLENQDPLKPMENADFLSQLAQFKSVTGIDELKSSVDSLATSLTSNQALQASSLVGRWVMAPGDVGMLWDQGGLAGAVDLPSSSEHLLVSITNKFGQMVKQLDLGRQEQGTVNFSWDGIGDDGNSLPPGEYKISALANMSGEYESVDTLSIVPVDSVVVGRGGASLTINTAGLGQVKLSDVRQIM